MSTNLKRCVVVLAVLALAAVAAQAKPNFSGEWKFNSDKSDFGEFPAPYSLTQKIVHEEPSLKVSTSMSSERGDMDFESTYTTDGKECVNTFGPGETKSTLKWDGDTLVIDGKGWFGDNEFTMYDEWTLAEDGKTLTIDRKFSSFRGEMEQKIVMDKQ